jgi:outer membrane protein, heavy metal efflux system
MRPYFLLVGLLLLAGCATQRYHARPLAPATMAAAYTTRSLTSTELHRYLNAHLRQPPGAWPPKTWGLNQLTQAAFYYSPDLDVARAKWGTARAGIVTAWQRPNPTLQLPFQYTTNPGDASPWTFGLGLDIPIETAGKRGYRVNQAQQLSDAARFSIGNVAWQVRSHVRTQLLNLYAASRRAGILHRQITAQSQVVAMLAKRLSVGAASAPEVNQQRINLLQSRTSLAQDQQKIQDARARLAAAIGVPVEALDGTRFNFQDFEHTVPPMPTAVAQRDALLNRADLLAALSQYAASQAALRLQIARQYPDLHLGPGYTWDQGANRIQFGVSGISLPIFNQNQGPIAEARARRLEAEANVKAIQAQAINETGRALANYRAALASLTQANATVAAQRRQLAALRTSFRAGATDRLTLTQAQQAVDTSLLSQLDAQIAVQLAIGQLEDAMQRPLSATRRMA